MREEITSFDLRFLIKELKERLVGGWVRNIKQIDKKFIFEIYKQEKFFLKIILPKAIFISKLAEKAPERPPSFCMQLRKYLLNKKISDIFQHEFDRIIEIYIGNYKVIIELFSKGNLILVDDKKLIVGLLLKQEWKDRILKPKTIYKYPPSNLNPFKYNFFEFQKLLASSKKEIVRFLAKDFGLGKNYAELICEEIEIDKNKIANLLNQQEADRIFRFFEQLEEREIKPFIILENENFSDFVPFEFKAHKKLKKMFFPSFNDTLQAYFEGKAEIKIEEKVEKIEKIREIQEKRLKELIEKELKYRKIASLLYEKYQLFDDILKEIFRLRAKHKDWGEIERIIKERTNLLKKIEPKKAKLVFLINGLEIEIDFRKSIKESANYYFELAKKMKRKIEGLKKAMEKIEIKIKVPKKPKLIKPKKKWYERYRWFISSDGILVVAGKNARNNETIVKRYVRKHDLVLHANLHGSPFAVIRNDKKLEVLPAETIYEAAELVASYSSAWRDKIPIVEVYYVKPEQVVKEPGLPLGSFVIRGERRWLKKIKPRISIGVKRVNDEVKIVYGPPTAVKKQTPYLVTIIPGDKDGSELAEEIKKELLLKVSYELKKATEEIDLEEIRKIIPYGKGELVR
jgi:predicted ribosome quality control (RQC) complex YloA/Tae2 family protein